MVDPSDVRPPAYTVRPARPEDLPALEALEAACWSEPLRAPVHELRARSERFPAGQLVLVWDDRVVAAMYSQRIAGVARLSGVTGHTAGSLHVSDGPILQLLALNALPELTAHGFGDRLLAAMLARAGAMPGIERVVAVTLCRDYARRAPSLSMEAYVGLRDAAGQLVDPLLRFHESHGARIVEVLDGYRPGDRDNLGKGVLIEYDLHRLPRATAGTPVPATRVGRASLLALFERAVCAIDRGRGAAYSARRAFSEMGLESLDLYALRTALERELAIEIEPTLFFHYPTPEALADHLLGAAPANHLSTDPPVTARAEAPNEETEGVEDRARAGADEPIAIIGMGCRFPGASDPEAFWSLLREGRDAVTAAPTNRPGVDLALPGGFLDHVDEMDALFFRISPKEAASIDPQQRLLLEVAWESLEHAGIDPTSLAGTPTGVFTGIFTHDYELLQARERADDAIDAYVGTGGSPALAAGRLSYFFGFTGPALAVNTACSSSLVAVHLACQSLRRGETDLALAAGVNLILAPQLNVSFARAGMLSPSGRCRTFDAAADGYVRSEGCGVVVLKRLSRAREDGDLVLAVVVGTAMNQDGASNGLTAPNALAQEAVVRSALADAGIAPAAVSYVEAHGTGTLLGDPVEVRALARVYGEGRAAGDPLVVSSVKTNIGHAEAAAGIAGLIKVVLSLRHDFIPAHLNVRELNPLLSLASIPAEVPTEGRAWRASPHRRRVAGISSFGFSGTNAHVVVEEAPPSRGMVEAAALDRPVHVLALSAMSEAALRQLAAAYVDALDREPHVPLADVCFTANTGRARFDHRLAVAATSPAELRTELAAFAEGRRPDRDARLHTGRAAGRPPRVAFLFTGQGSQYPGMGRDLYRTEPSFRRTLDRCAEILAPMLSRPLLDVIFSDGRAATPLDETEFTQPALFALEYALARLWMAWGVEPVALLGHSVGEYVAACVAGVFTLEDALTVIAARGRLMQALHADGAMVAALAPLDVVRSVMGHADEVGVAAVNGPEHVVISGGRARVEHVAARLVAENVRTIPLRVSHAFHSPLMEPMLADFERVLRGVTLGTPRLDVISNVTGRIEAEAMATVDYWVRHVREPVQFLDGMRALAERDIAAFLEIGPSPTLLGLGRRCLPQHRGDWLASLRAGADWESMAESVARLAASGATIDWARFAGDDPHRRRHLPTYPFQRTRHWFPRRSESERPRRTESERLRSSLEMVERLSDDEVVARLRSLSPGRRALLEASLREGHAHGEETAARLYDGLAETGADVPLSDAHHDRFLTYAPFADVVPGFSWATFLLAPERHPAHARLAYAAQVEMREVLFRHVDFAACRRALDLGCGYGSDMIALAERYSHLELDGYTISAKQAAIAHAKIQARNLETRVHAYHRDSVVDPFPARYDLAFGFEVVHHIRDKDTLFANLDRHLEDGGRVVLADFVSHVAPGIEDREGWSFFITPEEWAETLAAHGIEIVDCVDASPEIANFLHDERFDQHLAALGQHVAAPGHHLAALGAIPIDETVSAAFRSYHRGGELLRKGLAAYVLLTARKRVGATREVLARASLRALQAPRTYASLVPGRWVYRPEWRPLAGVARPPAAPEWERYREFTSALEDLAGAHIVAALDRLGLKAGAHSGESLVEIAGRLGVVPRHHRLLRRLLQVAGEVTESLGRSCPASTLAARYPFAWAELALVERCGSSLPAVLRGEQDPLEVLFPDGDLTTVRRLFADAVPFREMNRLLARALADVGAPLRVLEVGAGTGATTAAVLAELGDRPFDYVFTDVSALFTREAREMLGERPCVRYALLDLDRPPEPQGFSPGSFDVVIAVNVLHATADLRRTLRHVETLLAPGGTLLLGEITTRRRWLDLCFGLLDGWWTFADGELRPDHPLLTDTRWRSLLGESGFDDVRTVSLDGADLSVIIARRAPVATTRARVDAGSWIICCDAGGTGRALAARLEADGDACTLVVAADAFERTGEREFRVDPERRADFARVLQVIVAEGRAPLRGVVHLWGLDATRDDGDVVADAAASVGVGALRLIQALAEDASANAPPLWLVTRGAVAAGATPIVPGFAQSVLWGLAEVVDWEHPALACRRVDLDPRDGAGEIDALLAELRAPTEEDRIALRNGARHVERLARLPLSPSAAGAGRVRGDGTYLIIGGFGDLGLLVGEWLVARGARALALIGRRAPGALARETIARLEGLGAHVFTAQADVADRASLTSAFEDVVRSLPPVRGVVHAAGTLDDGILLQLDGERFRRVLAPKASGAWLLHELTRDCPLDFFVLFSSTASLLGNPGQGNHAAANAFLDALAHYRRGLGLPALSINWGPWAEIGAAARRGAGAAFRTKGIDPIPSRDGLAILDRLLAADVAQAAVVPVEWGTFLAERPAGTTSPLFRDLAPDARPAPARPEPPAEDRRVRARWERAPSHERRPVLVEFLRGLTARAVGGEAGQVNVDLPLNRMGLDSLMAVEMRHALHRELGVEVPVVTLMRETSVARLADHLEARMGASTAVTASAPPRAHPADVIEGEL